MGNLNVTDVQKYGRFQYTEDNYVLSGSFRATEDGAVTVIEDGQIVKDGSYMGNFYVSNPNGNYSSNVNNVPISELATVSTLIEDCFDAINTPVVDEEEEVQEEQKLNDGGDSESDSE